MCSMAEKRNFRNVIIQCVSKKRSVTFHGKSQLTNYIYLEFNVEKVLGACHSHLQCAL